MNLIMKKLIPRLVNMTIRILFLLPLLCFAQSLFAQEDTELWTVVEARYELANDLRADLKSGLRFNQNISEFKTNLWELGIRYRIVKGVHIRAAYRHSVNTSDRSNGQRFSTALFVKKKVNRVFFALRSKYQYDFRHALSQGSALMRNKVSVKYDKKKFPWTPSVFGEVFNPLDEINAINEWRLGTGLDYAFDKTKSLGLKYFYNMRLGNESRSARNVIALGLEWNLN